MSDEDIDDELKTEEHRYLFTVRQQFGHEPHLDGFYELKVPAGLTSGQAKVMTKLDPNWCKAEIAEDTNTYKMMEMRLRFNSDMFQDVCLVRTDTPITRDDLEAILLVKHREHTLLDFLKGAALKG